MDKKIYEEIKELKTLAVVQAQLLRDILIELKEIRRTINNG